MPPASGLMPVVSRQWSVASSLRPPAFRKSLKSQVSSLKSQASSLKSQVSSLKSQVSSLKSQVSGLSRHCATLRCRLLLPTAYSLSPIPYPLFPIPYSLKPPVTTLHSAAGTGCCAGDAIVALPATDGQEGRMKNAARGAI